MLIHFELLLLFAGGVLIARAAILLLLGAIQVLLEAIVIPQIHIFAIYRARLELLLHVLLVLVL